MKTAGDPRVRHFLQILDAGLKAAGKTRQRVEQEVGFTPGHMSRLLKGTVGLKLGHLYAISDAIGYSPSRLFAVAAETPIGEFDRATVIARLKGEPIPESQASSPVFDEAKIERMVRRALLRMFAPGLFDSND